MGISHIGEWAMNRQLYDTKRRVVVLRDRGRVTIPAAVRGRYGLEEGAALILAEEEDRLVLYPSREAHAADLLDRIGRALKERGLTLKEVLEQGEEIRTELFQERYPELADKYEL
jgi:AbrB family looped-hinge helix DNA binding protein